MHKKSEQIEQLENEFSKLNQPFMPDLFKSGFSIIEQLNYPGKDPQMLHLQTICMIHAIHKRLFDLITSWKLWNSALAIPLPPIEECFGSIIDRFYDAIVQSRLDLKIRIEIEEKTLRFLPRYVMNSFITEVDFFAVFPPESNDFLIRCFNRFMCDAALRVPCYKNSITRYKNLLDKIFLRHPDYHTEIFILMLIYPIENAPELINIFLKKYGYPIELNDEYITRIQNILKTQPYMHPFPDDMPVAKLQLLAVTSLNPLLFNRFFRLSQSDQDKTWVNRQIIQDINQLSKHKNMGDYHVMMLELHKVMHDSITYYPSWDGHKLLQYFLNHKNFTSQPLSHWISLVNDFNYLPYVQCYREILLTAETVFNIWIKIRLFPNLLPEIRHIIGEYLLDLHQKLFYLLRIALRNYNESSVYSQITLCLKNPDLRLSKSEEEWESWASNYLKCHDENKRYKSFQKALAKTKPELSSTHQSMFYHKPQNPVDQEDQIALKKT